MYCNGLPEQNIGFIPYVRKILDMLDSERLAIEPQLTLNLTGGREMCDRCMKTREEQIAWDKKPKRDVGVWRGEELKRGLEEGLKSKALLHHKIGACPQCGIGGLWAVCTSKNFDTGDYSPKCDYCTYVDNGEK